MESNQNIVTIGNPQIKEFEECLEKAKKMGLMTDFVPDLTLHLRHYLESARTDKVSEAAIMEIIETEVFKGERLVVLRMFLILLSSKGLLGIKMEDDLLGILYEAITTLSKGQDRLAKSKIAELMRLREHLLDNYRKNQIAQQQGAINHVVRLVLDKK